MTLIQFYAPQERAHHPKTASSLSASAAYCPLQHLPPQPWCCYCLLCCCQQPLLLLDKPCRPAPSSPAHGTAAASPITHSTAELHQRCPTIHHHHHHHHPLQLLLLLLVRRGSHLVQQLLPHLHKETHLFLLLLLMVCCWCCLEVCWALLLVVALGCQRKYRSMP